MTLYKGFHFSESIVLCVSDPLNVEHMALTDLLTRYQCLSLKGSACRGLHVCLCVCVYVCVVLGYFLVLIPFPVLCVTESAEHG